MYSYIAIFPVNSKILSQTVMKLHVVLGVQREAMAAGGRECVSCVVVVPINSSHRDSDIRLE